LKINSKIFDYQGIHQIRTGISKRGVRVLLFAALAVIAMTARGYGQEDEDSLLIPLRNWSQLPPRQPDTSGTWRNNTIFGREFENLLERLYGTPKGSKTPVNNTNLVAYDGRYIRSIGTRKVNIFSANPMDTAYLPRNFLERGASDLFIGTRDRIIRRNLLFQSGQPLDVFIAAENERLIRELPYIMDARFLVHPVSGSVDSVDLVLLTKDLFPLGFGLELGRADAGNAGLWYYNVLGYGHQFSVSTYWDARHTPAMGYGLTYGISNIDGTFFSSELSYLHQWNNHSGKFRISRDFKSLGLRYAGALQLENASQIREISLPDSVLHNVAVQFTSYDLWLGRIFRIQKTGENNSNAGFLLSGRYFNNQFRQGPPVSSERFYNYHDRTQLFLAAGFTRQGFRKDNMIYTFDRTEDVPYGYLFEITSGMEWGQFENRPYLGGKASFGKQLKTGGTVFGDVEFGTFFNQKQTRQGTLKVQFRGFTRLYTQGRFQYRNFFNLTYINGFRRNEDEYTSLENRGGITGLTGESLRGREKIAINLESVIFSPYRLLGFRFAFFGSFDFGMIRKGQTGLFQSRPFSRLGVGVRIRNEQLVFDTFELRFSLYPGIPADGRPSYVQAGTVPRLRMTGLLPDKPDLVGYF
jgi:hypothetical protein